MREEYTKTVFLSATYENLRSYRAVVLKALQRKNINVVSMENFGASSQNTKSECSDKLKTCDIYIGILGMQYGSLEAETQKSFTHLEYDEACNLKLDILIYVIDEENQPVLPIYVDKGEKAERLEQFKKMVGERHILKKFTNEDNLAKSIIEDLTELISLSQLRAKEEIPAISDEKKIKHLFNKSYSQIQILLNQDEKNDFYQKYIEEIYCVRSTIESDFKLNFLTQKEATCFVVCGQAGKGKTSLLCNLINSLVSSEYRDRPILTLLLNASQFTEQKGSLKDLILERFSSEKLKFSNFLLFSNLLKEQQVSLVVFIDAINEIKSAEKFQWLNETLSELVNEINDYDYPIKFCISCRSEFWRQFKGKMWTNHIYNPVEGERDKPSIVLENFEEANIDLIIQKYFDWYGLSGELLGEARESCKDPIMLRYLCMAFSQRPFNDKFSSGTTFRQVDIGTIYNLRKKEAFDLFVTKKQEQLSSNVQRIYAEKGIYGDINDLVFKATTNYLLHLANEMFLKKEATLSIEEVHKVAESSGHSDSFLDANKVFAIDKLLRSSSSIFLMFLDEDILSARRESNAYTFTFEIYFEYCLGSYFALIRWPKLLEEFSGIDGMESSYEKIRADFKHLLGKHAKLVDGHNFTNLFGALQFAILIVEEHPLYAEAPLFFIDLIREMSEFGIQGFDWMQLACSTISETSVANTPLEEQFSKGKNLVNQQAKHQHLMILLSELSEKSDFFLMWDIINTLASLAKSNFEQTINQVRTWAIAGKGLQPVFAAQSLVRLSFEHPLKIIKTILELGNQELYFNNFWLARSIIYATLEIMKRHINGIITIDKDLLEALDKMVFKFSKASTSSFVRGVALAALPFTSGKEESRLEALSSRIKDEDNLWCLWNLAYELKKWPYQWSFSSDSYLWNILKQIRAKSDDQHLIYAICTTASWWKNENKEVAEKIMEEIKFNRWQFRPIPGKMNLSKVNLCGIVYSPAYLEPATDNHIECRERLQSVIEKINTHCVDLINWIDPRPAEKRELEYAHNEKTDRHRDRSVWYNYIDDVQRLSKVDEEGIIGRRQISYSGPSELRNESYEAATLCVGGVLTGIDYVMNGPAEVACSMGRFPGHLANNTVSIFNNIAIGAQYAKYTYGINKILIIDCDVHHGIHTNRVFQSDPNVVYFSMHIEGGYAKEEGNVESVGEGLGAGLISSRK